ncbi:MAG: hypothetical protein EHM46_02080, partial [Bacteroidetes bacterium]
TVREDPEFKPETEIFPIPLAGSESPPGDDSTTRFEKEILQRENGHSTVTDSATITMTDSVNITVTDSATIAGTDTWSATKPGSAAVTTAGNLPEATVKASTPVLPANRDSLLGIIFPITFPGDDTGILDPFFSKLEDLQKGILHSTRILHIGDSQIENDRMTALIRFRLQRHFGGTGTGLVPAVPIYDGHLAYEKEERGDWLRHTFFGKRDTSITHRSYGVMGAFASVPGSGHGEWPMLHYRFNTSRRTGRFDRIRIFMHSFKSDARVAFQVNDTISDTLVHISEGFGVTEYAPAAPVKDLKISMGLPEGGRVYGISFESERGIQVDNIAMRGSAGLTFSRMDRPQLAEMLGELSPGLILFQFGGNVVPYLDPGYYRNALRKELDFIREISPGVPVILIGPADMSTKERGMYVSFPGLEHIRNALKEAAMESGCGFWDLYQAMGGRNSMPGFVEAEPPLATSDYVHFTPLGANLVAEMFYNSLLLEYNRFLEQRTIETPYPNEQSDP